MPPASYEAGGLIFAVISNPYGIILWFWPCLLKAFRCSLFCHICRIYNQILHKLFTLSYCIYCINLFRIVTTQSCKVNNFTVIMINENNNCKLSTFSTGLSTHESKKALQINFVKPLTFTVYIQYIFMYKIFITLYYLQVIFHINNIYII